MPIPDSSLAESFGGRDFRARASVKFAFVIPAIRLAKPERVLSLAERKKKQKSGSSNFRAENQTSFSTG